MNILLIGAGAREHSIALALKNSPSTNNLFSAPANPGILKLASLADIDISNHQSIIDFCKINNIDLVVVGPEQPLADGVADSLNSAQIPVFGPSKFAAQLESSKDFAKRFMIDNSIPTANYRSFSIDEKESAINYIKSQNLPIVIKADGLAAGKGVIIADDLDSAIEAINSIFDGEFGKAGAKIVIEEFMEGEEASLFAICDGNDFVFLASSQDHKRIGANDTGKNTGGMGSYAPAKIVTEKVLNSAKKEIAEKVLAGMKDLKAPYIGCLYIGLMIKNEIPKVVEFNCRFGDPETQSVLAVFQGDFAKLLYSAAIGKLDLSAIDSICANSACTVVIASKGYPDSFAKGYEIYGIEAAEELNISVLHAGTSLKEGKLLSAGGRVLSIVAKAENLKDAIELAYKGIDKIELENKYYRPDIGKKGL